MKYFYKNKFCYILFISVFLGTSCIDDLGNYDYNEVSKAIIVDSDKNTLIDIASGDILHIEPEISYTSGLGEGDFRYEWHNYHVIDRESIDSIHTEVPILNVPLPSSMSKTGRYEFYFRAINNKTNIAYSKVYIINVRNKIQIGYLALTEKAEGLELDLVASFNDTLTLYTNVLERMESEYPRKERTPIKIATFNDVFAPSPYDTGSGRIQYGVFILSKEGTEKVNAIDFSFGGADYSLDRISAFPAGYKPQNTIANNVYYNSGAQGYFYVEGNWFLYNLYMIPYYLSYPVNNYVSSGQTIQYKVSPTMAYSTAASSSIVVFFNEDEHRFMRHKGEMTDFYNSSSVLTSRIIEDRDGAPFSFNNRNYNLVHLGNKATIAATCSGFAVVHNTATSGYELLSFNYSSSAVTATGRGDIPSSINIPDVKHFVMHPTEPFLYCATDTRIYRVHTSTMNVVDLTSSLVPSGHRVSSFSSLYPKFRNPTARFSLATYDPGKDIDSCGTLQILEISDTNSGTLALGKHPKETDKDLTWSGMGKIVSVDYKEK